MPDDPLVLWARAVRREFRDYVREVGKVPSLAIYVSTRGNPRKANAWMRADIASSAAVVRDRLRDMAEEHGASEFAAVAGLHRFEDGHMVLLCAFDLDDDEKWAADADERGIGPWREGEFRFDLEDVREAVYGL